MTREDELMLSIEQGDTDAINGLLALYYPEIFRYCLWHMPNRTLAEDATQETFLKVFRHFDRYVHKGRFKPFLYQVAAHTCIDMQRKRGNAHDSLEEMQIEIPYEDSGFEQVQSDVSLRYIIRHLPASLKEIVILRFSQDMTLLEIAQTLGVPLRTAQSRLRSALKQIKSELQKEGYTE